MRVHRITLRNYRGVESCELTFAERGVTVVAGDNEVGKSSAAEALHLLIEHRDDTTRSSVKAVKALHLDVGAEVEAELSVGRHRFVYAKRWHRDRYTRLKVLAPEPQVLSGREAHDRVRAILAESVDLDLWRALSAPQADALSQQALRDHPSLVAALDAAAGGDLGAADDGQLLAHAEAEAGRWFTPTGRPKAALAELRAAAAEANAAVAASKAAIESVEADVAWCADLERAAAEAAARHAAAVAEVEHATAELAEVRERHAAVEGLAMAAELATTQATVAAGTVQARHRLVHEVEAAAASRATAHAALAAATAERDAAEVALAAAEEQVATTAADRSAAAAAALLAEARHQRLRSALLLADIEHRLASAEREGAALAAATSALAANPSSPAALAAVQAAHDDELRAEAALTAGQTSVRLDALADVTLTVDGVPLRLDAGGTSSHGVAGDLVVELPGALRLTVAAGAGVVALREALEDATATLAARCSALGVADLAGARELEDERRRLRGEAEARRAALATTLAGAELATMAVAATRARGALAAAEAALAAAGGGPADHDDDLELDDVRQAWDDARTALHAAERQAERAAARAEGARGALRNATRAMATAEHQLTSTDTRLAEATAALAAARAGAPDDALTVALAAARQRAVASDQAWREAAAIPGADLDAATSALRRATVERTGAERTLAQAREDLAAVRSRLELQGEAGHHHRLAEARRTASDVAERLASVEARAAAARLLVTTLTRHRDEAARAYGAPLRAQVEVLGRLVFGDDFAVVLDDDLRVAARVLDGVPVPWADLSVGAREQLAVITRLAAATLVSPDGGVPVVFDDVLGFSDPGRLALVAAAFEAAATSCQIIVFTCDAERYRHLPRALTHHLTAPRAVGTRQAG